MSNLYQRNGIWWARFKVCGVEYRESLRTRAEKVAQKRLKALRERVEDEARFGLAGPVTWPEAVVSWNEHIERQIGAATFTRYLVSLNQVRTFLDNKSVQQIDLATIRELVKARQRQGVSNATIRRDLTAISSVLAHAIDENWIEDNVANAFSRQRLPERRDPIVLPTSEAIALTIGRRRTRFGDMMLFARETGMREEEIAGLEHGAIDIKNRTATFTGKGRRLRSVPLSQLAIDIVQRQPRFLKCVFVFWHLGEDAEGKPVGMRYTNVSSNFGDYTRRAEKRAQLAGIEYRRFRFHDLRHLFAVEYLRDGKGGIYDLQRILGHGSVKTTEMYLAFLTPEQASTAMIGVAQKAAHKRRSGRSE
ncbi:MAG: tyrosine-type recombinase/integrase, partial [Sphingomonas sp.]|uniref:tyrosine-type recombinase/integrase n=1 Tax=Sphingomonas sp. TaxID=28214 RepID=UPI003561338A